MNFYQLGTMLHLKSIAILEELEAVTILPPSIPLLLQLHHIVLNLIGRIIVLKSSMKLLGNII